MNRHHWWNNQYVKWGVNGVILITFMLSIICLSNAGWDKKRFYSLFEDQVNEEIKEDVVSSIPTPTINIVEHSTNQYNETDKINNFILTLQPRLDSEVIKIISKSIIINSKKFGFPPELITALISRESSFNIIAVSSANCLGLMQINPKAHDDKIKKLKLKYNDLCKIDSNIKLGCMILREYYDREKDIKKALHRYVGGKETQYVLDILSQYANSQIKDVVKN